MSTRHELTDEQWAVIEPLLLKPKSGPGRPPADPRKTLNGILYVLKTGCAWADLPPQYGSPTTCWRRLKQWSEDGTWERIEKEMLCYIAVQFLLGSLYGIYLYPSLFITAVNL
ncbi:transposase [Melghirimyces thermohalophilus]|uniref:transposase n=1 Tax=Melghirimyces thermohalophilus TaxID=1236220 RepID=UPI000B880499